MPAYRQLILSISTIRPGTPPRTRPTRSVPRALSAWDAHWKPIWKAENNENICESHMTIEPANRMAALPPSFFQTLNGRLRQLQAARVDVIRMDMGSPDLPPAPQVIGSLQRSASDPGNHGYMPFGGLPDFRAAWANFYGRRFGVELDPDTELM